MIKLEKNIEKNNNIERVLKLNCKQYKIKPRFIKENSDVHSLELKIMIIFNTNSSNSFTYSYNETCRETSTDLNRNKYADIGSTIVLIKKR